MTNSTSEVAKIVPLIEDERSQAYFANEMHINQSSAFREVTRYKKTVNYRTRPVAGRLSYSTPQDDHYLILQALFQRHATACLILLRTLS